MKDVFRTAARAACLMLITMCAAPALAAQSTTFVASEPVLHQALAIATSNTLQSSPTALPDQQRGTAVIPATEPRGRSISSAPTSSSSLASLHDLVISYVNRGNADGEQDCLASAVYFEARSEPLEGQLAVAKVILNRAASGIYPTSICEVVKQPAQFSFVRRGRLPAPDKASDCWHRALAVADIARNHALVGEIAPNVLWYHATYVSPSWGRQRTRIAQIGKHIFFS